MLAACSATSSTASAPDTVARALDGLDASIDCAQPPAATALCWDGAKPKPFDAAAPQAPRCRAPVAFHGEMSMPAMAQRASELIAWGLNEQALRLSRVDWDAACKAAVSKVE